MSAWKKIAYAQAKYQAYYTVTSLK